MKEILREVQYTQLIQTCQGLANYSVESFANLTTLLLETVELSQVTPIQVQQFESDVFQSSPLSMELEKLVKDLRSFELHEKFSDLVKGALKLIVNKMKVKQRYEYCIFHQVSKKRNQ